jgi:SulP family sulfate permease
MVLIMFSGVTVATDLAIAVVVGVIVSALVFVWEHAKHIRIDAKEDHKGSTVYALTGPLFFCSVTSFLDHFDPSQDNEDVIIDFARSRVADHS